MKGNYFIILVLILNIASILSIFFCKLNYKREKNAKFFSNFAIASGTIFIAYTLCLIVFSTSLIQAQEIYHGLLGLFLASVPFMIGQFSTYKKADLFINMQLFALFVNLFFTFGCC